jgi:hypothetical protein
MLYKRKLNTETLVIFTQFSVIQSLKQRQSVRVKMVRD